MNITKLAAFAVAAIVITGCATTAQFNPNNKGIMFSDGKHYLIPYLSVLLPARKEFAVTNEALAELKNANIHGCKRGDRIWIEAKFGREIAKLTENGKRKLTEGEGKALMVPAFRNQRLGCTSALSEKVAADYLKYQQAIAMQRAIQRQRNNYAALNPLNNLATNLNNAAYQTNQMSQMNLPPPRFGTNSSGSGYNYKSSSGTRYKYDLSKPSDRVLYDTDPSAQIQDEINPRVGIDRSLNQYGGGASR